MDRKVSIVIPVFNEEENVEGVYSQIKDKGFEIIWINDGSTDKTGDKLKELMNKDETIKVINFENNQGKAMALRAGFETAGGEVIVTMDGDGQDGPENIPAMLSKLDEGYDLVVGWKKVRQDPAGKRISSKIWNWIVCIKSGMRLHDFNSGLKVMRREVVKTLDIAGGKYRFIPIMAAKQGFKVTEIPVVHHQRLHGKSKYGHGRFFGGFRDILTVKL